MLSARENERLTRVGRGTPMGELLRRYWHPVAATAQLADNPVKAVRILGEDLVLFRMPDGQLGLVDEACPHRGTSLVLGVPEVGGIRCAYHGW
ncbi:MAG: Rieske 2Fe-2S domain-containing protein, partial [Chloroflexi bacterium]|nr:Rieske 2Fe-2S domain-containing protein [Chloroflexota bacterium]